jgi:predicted peptidase
MKNLLLSFFLLLAFAVRGQVNTFVPLGTDKGSPYGYIVIKKPEAKHALIALHGIGERGDGKTQLSYLERNGIPYINKRGLLNQDSLMIFCPQQPKFNSSGAELGKYYWKTLCDFMVHCVRKYNLSNEVHITGLSMGAYSITKLMEELKRNPDYCDIKIVSVLLVSAAGDESHMARGAVYLPARLRAVHGLEDSYKPEFAQAIVNSYNAAAPMVPAVFIGLEFLRHEDAVWNSVYRSPKTYKWMLSR